MKLPLCFFILRMSCNKNASLYPAHAHTSFPLWPVHSLHVLISKAHITAKQSLMSPFIGHLVCHGSPHNGGTNMKGRIYKYLTQELERELLTRHSSLAVICYIKTSHRIHTPWAWI